MYDVSIALAKVYKYLEDCGITNSDFIQRPFGPDDVISILKNANLTEKDFNTLRILFNSSEPG